MQGKKTSQETAAMSSELQTNPKGPQTAPKSPIGLLRKRGQEAIPKMQPAMMMFSSKYWARRGLSLDSAMYDQQHLAASMVSTEQLMDPRLGATFHRFNLPVYSFKFLEYVTFTLENVISGS